MPVAIVDTEVEALAPDLTLRNANTTRLVAPRRLASRNDGNTQCSRALRRGRRARRVVCLDAVYCRLLGASPSGLRVGCLRCATRLLKLNPKYREWATAVPTNADGTPGDVDRYTFIRASVWADDIKTYDDYAREGDASDAPAAAQNIGYRGIISRQML